MVIQTPIYTIYRALAMCLKQIVHCCIASGGLYGDVLAARGGVHGKLLDSEIVASDVVQEIANRHSPLNEETDFNILSCFTTP